jgi:predicted HTH domain antitoxin
MGRLSTGGAAELANVPKLLFLTKLADYGVDTFDLSEEELRRDLASARRHL